MGMVAETFVRARLNTSTLAGEMERDIGRIARGAGEKAGVQMSAGMKVGLLASLGVTAGVAAAFVASARAAGNFEASMVKLTTTAGETGTMVSGNLKKVSAGILELASSTGTGTKQLADGMYLVESAGFHGAAGLTVLKASAQGARAEQANMATVTNAVTSALKSYNLGSDASVSITNQMVAAVGHGKTTFEAFSGSLSTVLPLAAAAHISFAEVAGAVATMTNHGTSAAEATQQLAFTIRALQAPNIQAVKEMDRLGLSSVDVASHLGERGLTGTLKLLTEAVARKLGPEGLVMIDTLNKSANAARDASIMINAMPPSLQKLAQGFLDGKITVDQWHDGIKGIPADQAAMVKQFATLVSHTTGFNDLLKKGGPAAQTMADAIKKMTGGANGLNTTLMLTGGNLTSFEGNVAAVADAGKHAGKDIEGWGVIQETFNFKLSAFKGQLEAAGIALGQGLLPVIGKLVTIIAAVLLPITSWMTAHQQLSAIVIASIGGIAALIVLTRAYMGVVAFVKGATLLWAAATWIFNAAQGAMTVMMSRTLIMVVLYETWTKIIAVATKVWAAVQWVLNAALSANPIGIVIVVIGLLVAAVIYAWTHFAWFRTVVIDVWHAIQAAIKFAWEDVIKPVVSALVWFWQNILGPTVMWLWRYIIYPAWTAIRVIIEAAVIAIQIYVKGLVAFWQLVLAPTLMWLWQHIFKPVWEGIQLAIHWATALIKQDIAELIWFWQHALGPALSAIGDLFKRIWHDVSETFTSIWEHGIKPVFDGMMHFITVSVPHAFEQGVKLIGGWWETLSGWAAIPVNFIIDTIINKGIVDTINTVASFFGVTGRVSHVSNPLRNGPQEHAHHDFAEGGHVRGPGTGTSDSIAAWLSNGEYVIPTRVVQQHGVTFFNQLIGKSGKSSGGTAPAGSAIGGGHGHGFADGGLVGLITDPIGWIKGKVGIDAIANKFGGGAFIRAVTGAPARLLGEFVDWVKSKIASMMSSGGGPTGAGPGFPPWPSSPGASRGDSGVWRSIVNLVRGTGIPYTFGNAYRAGDPLWHGSGRAVDFMGFNQDRLAGFFMSIMPRVLELIHRSGSRDYAVTRGQNRGSFNNALMEQHRNHVHIAMARGGLVNYDAGGMVAGALGSSQLAIVHGGEQVLTPDQQHGGGFHGNVIIQIGNEEFQGYVDTRIQHDRDLLTQAFGAGRRRQ